MAIVNKGEPCTLTSTILCAETEARNLVFVGFVEFGKLLAEFIFGDVGAVRMENITTEKRLYLARRHFDYRKSQATIGLV